VLASIAARTSSENRRARTTSGNGEGSSR
jgi:hypothetical protein